MLRIHDPYSVSDKATRRLAAKLALRGHARSGSYAPAVHADWVVYCDDPVTVYRSVRPGNGRRSVEVSFPAPCRKCDKCQRFRRMRWRQRIINEILMNDDRGARTWMVTLTFDPIHLAGVLQEAKAIERRGKPPGEAVEQAAYAHVQRFFKRLRKNAGPCRYCAVPEYGGEHGRLHYHVILHEVSVPLLKRHIQACWRSFSHCKLVDGDERGIVKAASYVSKYVSKDGGRPRASQSYGTPPSGRG